MLEPMRYELASFAFWPQFRAGVIIVVASEWENFSSLTFVNFSHSDDVFWQYWAFNNCYCGCHAANSRDKIKSAPKNISYFEGLRTRLKSTK